MTFVDRLPEINASLNAIALVLLFSGWVAIRKRRQDLHWKLMVATFTVSTLFLAGYLTRVYFAGTERFQGTGLVRTVYLTILISHMILAMAVPPLAITVLYLAARKNFAKHKRIAPTAFYIWLYVSLTGVMVYGFLHHWPV